MRELSLAILEIAENSIKAFATRIDIALRIDSINRLIYIMIGDNGIGTAITDLNELALISISDKTKSKLGLLLVNQLVENCGGKLEIQSNINKGTLVKATMQLDSLDLPPIGDLAGTIATLNLCKTADISLDYTVDGRSFSVEFLRDEANWYSITNAVNENIEIINGGNP